MNKIFKIPTGKIKGWEFGSKQRVAAARVDGNYYAIQGECPRCAFDLFKGDLIRSNDKKNKTSDPIIACPTCATTYSLITGKHGEPIQRSGLAGWVSGLAKTATISDASADAKAFVISTDGETGGVFCRER